MNRFASSASHGVRFVAASIVAGALLSSCGSSGGSSSAKKLNLQEVQNGFGLVLPYQVKDSTAPFATAPILKLQTLADLKKHVSSTNPILPVSTWPTTATLPSGATGNHFIAVEFTQPLDAASILDGTAGSPTYGLKGTITVTQRDMSVPSAPVTTAVEGRAFVNGYTSTATGTLTKVISLNSGGQPTSSLAAFNGFPGVSSNFSGASKLVSPNVFVFVADSDNNLNTIEAFPAGVQILISATAGVLSDQGKPLLDPFVCSSTVGADTIAPEILIDATQNPNVVAIDPADGSSNVSPLTDIEITFTEPTQPAFVGDILNTLNPTQIGTVRLTSGSQSAPTQINFPFSVTPKSVYDLTTYVLKPTISFPAQSPVNLATAPVLNFVQMEMFSNKLGDLIVQTNTGIPGISAVPANPNTVTKKTAFQTGAGPGIVNAPVAPEVIYVGRNGPSGGISVIDLNGFGQSTGDPTHNFGSPALDNDDVSKFPFNPNIAQSGTSGQIVPPMASGNTTLDGGSAGVFTLTKDTSLSDLLYVPGTISDIHIGQPLDRVFNNAPTTVGGSCLTGGNRCAAPGFQTNTAGAIIGAGNTIDRQPVPNPPKLIINPALNCFAPLILGEEPIFINSLAQNILVPGNAFGTIGGVPPNGLVYSYQGSGLGVTNFNGPSPDQPPASCPNFFTRQQIGHFLYVVDTSNKEVQVLNSNRMTVIDRIKLSDPRKLAISPDLKTLAVTNFGTDSVSFIGIDPLGSNFHQVIKEVAVGNGPLGVAWHPGNEDVFVCNNLGSSVTVIRAFDLTVRKTFNSNVSNPIDVYMSERQSGLGFSDGVYFAFILNQNGTIAVFESGPSTTAGAIGFDDSVGLISATFANPVGIVPGYYAGVPSAYVLHQSPSGNAMISLVAETASPGQQPLDPQTSQGGNFTNPSFRNREFTVAGTISSLQFSGSTPSDLALDDCVNFGGTAGNANAFSALPASVQSGKELVRGTASVSLPNFIFVACGDVGVVDVIQFSTFTKFKPGGSTPVGQQQFAGSISAPGCAVLSHYWRQ